MHKSHEALKAELKKAVTQVEVGSSYYHYKNPDIHYKVLFLAFTEENDKICVIYQLQTEDKLIFVRPLTSWLEKVEWNRRKVDRFTFVKKA